MWSLMETEDFSGLGSLSLRENLGGKSGIDIENTLNSGVMLLVHCMADVPLKHLRRMRGLG